MEKTVSITTLTQLKRFGSIQILKDMIKGQTYKNIIEWVLVEGSQKEEDACKNAANIETLREDFEIPIVYIEYVPNSKIGALRNRGNKMCKGDITVCLDDDDYYFPERVEHAVLKLNASKHKIAGCTAIVLYDFILQRLYKFKGFAPFHGTNNTMAWKAEYIKNHTHDETVDNAEESSFTNNFSEPMVQLDALKSLIVCSHDYNTYNKRELLTSGTVQINPNLKEIPDAITRLMPLHYFDRYQALFFREKDSPYDIVYMTGGFCIPWDPKDDSLGGSEQAVVNLSEHWARIGKKVAVYANTPVLSHNGVDYKKWDTFPFEENFKVVVIWRWFGIGSGLSFPIKAKQIWVDFHDRFEPQFKTQWNQVKHKVNRVCFKSEFHKELFEESFKEKLPDDKILIIPNGVRVEDFRINVENTPRNPYRFCYASCYTRGLLPILQYMWPIIFKNEPRAEFHIYYGMDHVRDENILNSAKTLLAQPGVMDHGRQPRSMIIREKYASLFHLYITNTTAEIDCISIRESCAAGCIPLLSNSGVFKHRDGLHFELRETEVECYQQIACRILDILKEREQTLRISEQIKSSQLLLPWSEVGDRWLKVMDI
jgi:glycosyltransferase involved in cell wall biosynthesis